MEKQIKDLLNLFIKKFTLTTLCCSQVQDTHHYNIQEEWKWSGFSFIESIDG